MAEINKDDLISQEALRVPLDLAENLQKVVDVLNQLIIVGKRTSDSISKASSSGKVKKEVEGITQAQKELDAVSKQLAKAQAQNNVEYQKQSESLSRLKKDMKDVAVLGEQDAKSVSALTSSRNQLRVALEKNKRAYSDLTNEEQRSSKAGKELLSIVQRQDKEYKHLSDRIKETKVHVGDYAKATEGLNNITGGTIDRVKMLGQQFLALIKNPIVAIIAAIAASFIALRAAAQSYYTTTAEGEEKLKEQEATWKAFELSRREGWNRIGKAASEAWADVKRGFALLFGGDDFEMIEAQLDKLDKLRSKLIRDHAIDVVSDAQTEIDANKLIEISRNKLDFKAEERMTALRQHNKIRKEQLEGDIQLAKDDLLAEEKKLEALGREITFGRMLGDMTNEEIKATGMMNEEVASLAAKQAALLKVESDASSARIGFLKLERALRDEIHKEKVEQIMQEFDVSMAAKQAEVDKAVKLIQDEVVAGRMIKVDGDKQIADLRKAISDDLIQAQIDGLSKVLINDELTADERLEIEKRLAKLKIDLNNAVYDQVIALDEATVEHGKSTFELIVEAYQNFSDSLTSIFTSGSQERINAIDDEIAKLNEQLAVDLKNAGDNDEYKANLEKNAEARREELEKKKKSDQRKVAVADKAAAIIDAGIKAAQAYLVQLASPPAVTAIPRAIGAGILGAIQVAAIAAKPLPKFAKGVKGFEGGSAIVGEEGREFIRTGSKLSLSPSTATVVDLPKGADVIPHDKTMRMLAMQSIGQEHYVDLGNAALYGKVESLEQTTKKYSKQIVEAIENSGSGSIRKHGSILYEEHKRHDGSVKLIRLKNLSK